MTFLQLIGVQESLRLAQLDVRHVTRLFLLLKRVWPARLVLSPTVIDSDSKQSLQEEEERPQVAQAQDYLCF